MRTHVICLPGGVAPATQRYAPLVAAVDGRAELHLKDLEVYREEAPPLDYSVDEELKALDRFADSLDLGRFHLLGYSGGGFLSLAYAGTRPDRLQSLALFEPAMIPGHKSPEEQIATDSLKAQLEGLEGPGFMAAFVRAQLKPGVQSPPPPSQPVPGMQKRPAGIAAMMRSFEAYSFDRETLRATEFPVYLGYGDLTHEKEAVQAAILGRLFGDIHIQRFAGVHHFVTPERIYTPAHARALEEIWARGSAEELAPQQ
jgi:pimeloyl-ACP methyl ester carboxylesterase